MTDWTTLPNVAVGVGGLPSGTTVTALRDNPIAIAEGAPGAPRVLRKAIGGLVLNSLEAVNTSWAGLVDLQDYNEIIFSGYYACDASTSNNHAMQIRFSTNNGATWSAEQPVFNVNQTGFEGPVVLHLNFDTGKFSAICQLKIENGNFTVPTGVNGIQLRPKRIGTGNFKLLPRIVGGRG